MRRRAQVWAGCLPSRAASACQKHSWPPKKHVRQQLRVAMRRATIFVNESPSPAENFLSPIARIYRRLDAAPAAGGCSASSSKISCVVGAASVALIASASDSGTTLAPASLLANHAS